MKKIMLIEPDQVEQTQMSTVLMKAGYDCVSHTQPADIELGKLADADMVIMSTYLAWSDSFRLLESMRANGCTVLFLAGDQSNEAHLRAVYRHGCAVLQRPVDSKRLLAAVSSLSRASSNMLIQGSLQLDLNRQLALYKGEKLSLTTQEFRLLCCLMQAENQTMTREQLLHDAWGYVSVGETRTVDVHIQRLRKKMGPECIETIYRKGYKLCVA